MGTPPRHVPTLTEVVDEPWPFGSGALPLVAGATVPVAERESSDEQAADEQVADAHAAGEHAADDAASMLAERAVLDDARALEERLATRLQQRLDALIDERVERHVLEVLAPAVARLAEERLRQTRHELAAILRDAVAEALAEEGDARAAERAGVRADEERGAGLA